VTTLAGPLAIAAVLLVAGGVAKLRTPLDTARALQGVGIAATPVVVRVGAAAEVVVGVLALLVGGPLVAALVGLSYLAFALFVVRALRDGAPISSCGCFGKVDTPPSLVHIVLDGAVAACAAAVAFTGTDVSMPAVLPDQPLVGVPFVLLVVVGTGLVFLAFTALPRTLAAVKGAA
jgi:hypothetical protein